ncbi:hypothetical protein [Salmonirosea aquatica]|uniref:Uncharacterized protein n=1 Tax=Salmonirosea aquatica TaxID=2654236 RepID=A0A7C9FSB4_9BACT|nr:hypothetical protein [Cytophagaceae bacterium SJW1-29]
MDFQELSTLWNSNDQEISQQIEIKQKLVKEASMRQVRVHLAEIKWTSYFELAVNLLFVQFMGRYLVDNFSEMKFFVPGLLLFALTAVSLIFSTYKLTLYYGIQAGFSVVQTQRKVARLRYLELLGTNLLYVAIPLFYAPFMIVIAKVVAGYDLYRHSAWLAYGTLGSMVVALVVVYLLKKFPSKRLQEAQSFLAELKEAE